jgi:regulator of cell morphogenesis and NO signaling
MEIRTKSLAQLVETNYAFGSVLHFFGIDFFKHPEETLERICHRRHLSATIIERELQARQQRERVSPVSLMVGYPVDMIMAHLRQAHRVFVRRRLPYLLSLVEGATPTGLPSPYRETVADLQIAFPLFAEDFIRHVQKEEAEMFEYITLLDDATYGHLPTWQLYQALNQTSVAQFAQAHSVEDDDMQKIRELTQHYAVAPGCPLLVRVLYAELLAFEEELQTHAEIEDRLLLVKAAKLEQKVTATLALRAKLN